MKPVLALLVIAVGTALGFAATIAAGQSAAATTTVAIHYSRFTTNIITATAGVPLTITLRNDDPIEHEWIVGSDAMHERHRTGTEPFHDQVPTEVTVPALSTRVTTVILNQPGDYAFICHLPGHEAYGMRGVLRVIAP